MFLAQEKLKYEKKGWTWKQESAETVFSTIDTNEDGVISGAEKKAYWGGK